MADPGAVTIGTSEGSSLCTTGVVRDQARGADMTSEVELDAGLLQASDGGPNVGYGKAGDHAIQATLFGERRPPAVEHERRDKEGKRPRHSRRLSLVVARGSGE